MNEVLEELKEETINWICYQLDGMPYDHGSLEDMMNYVRNNKDLIEDRFTESPFWNYCMEYRDRYFGARIGYQDINKKVLYDYALTLLYSPIMTNEELNKHELETRQIMWREAQKEKLFLLYGKIPDDVFNHILSLM